VTVYRDDHEREEAAVASRFVGWRSSSAAALALARADIAGTPWEYATIDAGHIAHDHVEPGIVLARFVFADDGPQLVRGPGWATRPGATRGRPSDHQGARSCPMNARFSRPSQTMRRLECALAIILASITRATTMVRAGAPCRTARYARVGNFVSPPIRLVGGTLAPGNECLWKKLPT